MGAGTDDTVALLSRVPVFETLGPDELRRVAQVAVPRHFEAGHVVFHQNDESDTCYIVRDGHARAVTASPDGRTITLASFGPGDFFGELALLDRSLRDATVTATTPMEIIVLSQWDFETALTEAPRMTRKLMAGIARRLRELDESTCT